MKKRNQVDVDNEEEFEVDEPDELVENSDDDWSPQKSAGKRASTGRGRKPKKAKKDSDEEESDDEDVVSKKKKTPVKGKPIPKKPTPTKKKGKPVEEEEDDDELEDDEEEEEPEDEEDDEEEEEEEEEEEGADASSEKAPKEFSSGAFVVAKADLEAEGDPPLWKIDGKALLQKYVPFQQDGKTLYKNTSVYSGWTLSNKDQYYPASVTFKQQTRKEHIIEFNRSALPK